MRRAIPAATSLSVKVAGIASAVTLVFGFAAGCGGTSKPSAAVAGCDLSPVSDPSLPVKYMVALELYNDHLVTGTAQSSAFEALFSGGRVHDQGALLGWYTLHENDGDLLIANRTPGEWDSQLTLNVFPKPYTAYHAYCTGWSFRDYAGSHWQQVPVGVRSAVTPTSAKS